MKTGYRIDNKDDLISPIIVTPPETKAPHMQEADKSFNAYVLRQRESLGKRTILRLNFEVYGRKNSKSLSFNRLRNKHLLVSLPSGDQAEAFMAIIEQVAKGLNGKHLAKSEGV